MKGFSLAILLLTAVFAVNSVSAQRLETGITVKRPDFSGKWRLDPSKSGDRNSFIPCVFVIIMTIEQNLPSIRFRMTALTPVAEETPSEEVFTLYVDGRGDKYAPAIANGASTTSWSDNKLLVTVRNKANAITGHQQFELMPNGRRLKLTWLGPDGLVDSNPENTEWLDKID